MIWYLRFARSEKEKHHHRWSEYINFFNNFIKISTSRAVMRPSLNVYDINNGFFFLLLFTVVCVVASRHSIPTNPKFQNLSEIQPHHEHKHLNDIFCACNAINAFCTDVYYSRLYSTIKSKVVNIML